MTHFTEDKSIKWVIAQKINDGDWRVLRLSFATNCPSLNDDTKDWFDSIPMGEFNQSQFAVFRNRPDWRDKKPYRLVDCRDRSNEPIPASLGMWVINQADAGYL